ncbi:MAG: cytochrome c oxidase subunit 3, partial [Bacteroidota bacterium]
LVFPVRAVAPSSDVKGEILEVRTTSGFRIADPVVIRTANKIDKNHEQFSDRFTHGGANMKANEYGPPGFAALFFFVTGFHGTHVLSGVVLLVILYLNVVKGTYERRGHYEMTEKIGLYWHFVDLVWVFVFTFFYLI